MPREVLAPKVFSRGEIPQLSKSEDRSYGALMIDNTLFYDVFKATNDRAKADLGVLLFLMGCA